MGDDVVQLAGDPAPLLCDCDARRDLALALRPDRSLLSCFRLRGALPEGPKTQEKLDDSAPDERTPFRGKLVIARTRKGRGGKTVTTVEGIDPKLAALDDVARDLRKALGGS